VRLYRTSDEKREQETRNGVIQFLAVLHYAGEWKTGESHLTPDLVCELQRLTINQIYTCAGKFRDGPVSIQGVNHEPPPHDQVPALVAEMCDYVNAWDKPAVHLASYLMWRINWIHPFFGGNGRTARAASYLIMCAKLGFLLPGAETIPDLILADRKPYYDALRQADKAWEKRVLDISEMEGLMSSLLAKQLVAVHKQATGKKDAPN
jgi:Fic family protein